MGRSNSKQKVKNDEPQQPFQLPSTTYDIIMSRLSQRDWKDRLYFDHSVKGVAGVCLFSSLIINTTVRKSLMVYEGFIYSTAIVGFLSCLLNNLCYHQFVQWPILEGKLNCSSCAIIRASGIQMATAVVFPCLLSFSLGVLTAEKFNSATIPHPNLPLSKEFRDYVKQKLYPSIRGGVRSMLIFQAIAGAWISYKQYMIGRELLSTLSPQDVTRLWKETFKIM